MPTANIYIFFSTVYNWNILFSPYTYFGDLWLLFHLGVSCVYFFTFKHIFRWLLWTKIPTVHRFSFMASIFHNLIWHNLWSQNFFYLNYSFSLEFLGGGVANLQWFNGETWKKFYWQTDPILVFMHAISGGVFKPKCCQSYTNMCYFFQFSGKNFSAEWGNKLWFKNGG